MATATKNKPVVDAAPKADPLNRKELAQDYGYALRVIYSNPEIRSLFEKAVNAKGGQWTPQKFTAELQNTDWWQNNSESARLAFAAERMGGADWAQQQENARLALQQEATTIGSQPSAKQMDDLVHRYIYEGWSDPGRQQLMSTALAESINMGDGGDLVGESGNLQDNLRRIAEMNGVKLSDGFYQSAARSVASNLTTADDWLSDVTEQAASMWPTYADKIRAGSNVRELASGYINTMSNIFDITPDSVSLDDPYLKQAMGGVNDKGEPQTMGLWQFEQMLRKDPRWMGTRQATNKIADIGTTVLKMFGFQS